VVERRSQDEHLGDLVVAVDGRLWCVRETASGDELVEVRPDGIQRILTATDGFLGSTRPLGKRVAWLRWDADRMPWDGTELLVAGRRSDGLAEIRRIAGGPEESVTQPCWGHDGRLWFASDRTGWWNLYTWAGGHRVPAAPMAADIAPPQWESGYPSFCPLPNGDAIMIVHDGPEHRLVVQHGSQARPIQTAYTSFKPYLAVADNELVGVGASPWRPPHVFALDWQQPGNQRVLAEPATTWPTRRLSLAESLRVPTSDGQTLRALQLGPQLPVVVDASVEGHGDPGLGIDHRLCAVVRRADDAQRDRHRVSTGVTRVRPSSVRTCAEASCLPITSSP
jgi:hypothetical protein